MFVQARQLTVLVPKQTGADFIDTTNMETKPNKYTVDGGIFLYHKNKTYKVKQKMLFCFLVETLSKLGFLLYLQNSNTWGILRKLSPNRWSSTPIGTYFTYLDHHFPWWSDLR